MGRRMAWVGGSYLDLLDGGRLNIMTPGKGLIQATSHGQSKTIPIPALPYTHSYSAANATSHLFFAYLRSLSPDSPRGAHGIIGLPISLQQLMDATEYPPEASKMLINDTTKVV